MSETAPRPVAALRGVLPGVGVGATIAAYDVLFSRAVLGTDLFLLESMKSLGWAVGAGALAGLILGSVRPRRPGSNALVLAGSGIVLAVGMAAGLPWIPGLVRPLSLVVDIALVAAVWAALGLLGRGSDWPERAPVWVSLLLLGIVGTLAGTAHISDPDRPPAPEPTRERHPDVLLIVVDTLRADHTSLHGYERDTTPNLRAFAEGALRFSRAHAPSPWTRPSVASLLTGLPPVVHGAEDRASPLPRKATTVAEFLREAGYATALFSNNPHVSARFGIDQGFDLVDELVPDVWPGALGPPAGTLLGRSLERFGSLLNRVLGVEPVSDRGSEYLYRSFFAWSDTLPPDKPWFCYLHTMEPHLPYDSPAPWNSRYSGRPQRESMSPPLSAKGLAPLVAGKPLPPEELAALVDAYDSEILWWDHLFGDFLEELGKRAPIEDLVILVTSDHGEGFYEHGTWGHRNSLHEELLHVPLAVRAPALPAGDVDALVSLESVPATLLVLAGFAPPPETVQHHRELVPAPVRSAPCAASLQFAGTRARSLILDGKKWIEVSRGERRVTQLFDVSRDPLELNSLPTSGDEVARRMRAEAGRLFDFHERLSILSNVRADMSDLEETLRGLGYVR